VSMLSARGKPDANGYAPPIVPEDLPEGASFAALVAQIKNNDIVKGKFLSDDGELALLVLALDRKIVDELTPKVVIGSIRDAAEKELAGTGMSVKLTGAPVMQLEIRNAVERDRLVYNGLGFLAGFVMAYLFFRRLSLTLIAVLGPSIAILWTLGVLGGLDFRLNLFINVITPLILVSGFSDSMHLVFAIRREIMSGTERVEAARKAVRDVAPACLLTAMNACLALASFSFAESALIRTFGVAALLAVAISYIAVAVVVPTLAALLIQRESGPPEPDNEDAGGGIGLLHRVTGSIVEHVIARPLVYVLFGIALTGATGYAYAQLVPMYRLADQVPDKEQALDATGRLDKKLTGANPVHVMISWGGTSPHATAKASLYDETTLQVIADVHRVVEGKAGLGNTWSIDSLRRWLREAGDDSIDTVKKYVGLLPEHLVRRFIAVEENAVLVTARLPDIDASQILPVVDKLDAELAPVRAAHPGYDIAVTGLPAIAARNSAKLIGELNWGLIGDMAVIFVFLAIALRSMLAGVTSVLPSLFPIFATGALLFAAGEGLQFASIIAITVAFALAIDSTIHFLNRFRLEEERLGGGAGSEVAALRRTVHHIGPAVVLTTIVLALGLGVTMLSDLPSLRRFGELTAICLLASLIGQLVILPASIALYRRYIPRKS
ncbi:MAG: efflux RND transporter permease subunit, partial [Hyphomicrobium sp.]